MQSGVRWQCDMGPDTGIEVDTGFALCGELKALRDGGIAQGDRNTFDSSAYLPAKKRGTALFTVR